MMICPNTSMMVPLLVSIYDWVYADSIDLPLVVNRVNGTYDNQSFYAASDTCTLGIHRQPRVMPKAPHCCGA